MDLRDGSARVAADRRPSRLAASPAVAARPAAPRLKRIMSTMIVALAVLGGLVIADR
jgi:hypothetical protein